MSPTNLTIGTHGGITIRRRPRGALHRGQLAEGGVEGDEAVACRPELGDHLWEGRGVER